jgi:hypothetical protein
MLVASFPCDTVCIYMYIYVDDSNAGCMLDMLMPPNLVEALPV